MSETPDFRRGAEAAAEATKGGGYARTEYFRIEDGKEAWLRFLTDADAWITVLQHQMVPTKEAPEGYTGKWPKQMGAVCRKDPAFAGIYEDCYICDYIVDGTRVRQPGARVWALAVLREQVFGDGSADLGGPEMKGRLVGIRDVTRDVTIPAREAQDGQAARPEKKVTEKAIVVVNMGYKNFFNVLEGFAHRYGTVLDRDYWIKRSGAGTDTTYQIVPEDPIMVGDERFDLREPKFMERYTTDLSLEKVVTELSSDEFYAKFFDPRYVADKGGSVSATGAAPEQQVKPEGDVDPERMKALADRVKGYGASSEAQPEPVAAGGGMKDFG